MHYPCRAPGSDCSYTLHRDFQYNLPVNNAMNRRIKDQARSICEQTCRQIAVEKHNRQTKAPSLAY